MPDSPPASAAFVLFNCQLGWFASIFHWVTRPRPIKKSAGHKVFLPKHSKIKCEKLLWLLIDWEMPRRWTSCIDKKKIFLKFVWSTNYNCNCFLSNWFAAEDLILKHFRNESSYHAPYIVSATAENINCVCSPATKSNLIRLLLSQWAVLGSVR